MSIGIDFMLSHRFGAVEQTIFRLVLNDVPGVRDITALLSIYTDDVIANAIKRLVNYQLLRADLEKRVLWISDPVQAVIESCLENSNIITLPPEVISFIPKEGLLIEDYDLKSKILSALLPGINLGFLVKSLDFIIYDKGDSDE